VKLAAKNTLFIDAYNLRMIKQLEDPSKQYLEKDLMDV